MALVQPMQLKQAVKILKEHNEWRRDNDNITLPITTPKDLGIAIDVIVEHLTD